jgi:hypothetical protein
LREEGKEGCLSLLPLFKACVNSRWFSGGNHWMHHTIWWKKVRLVGSPMHAATIFSYPPLTDQLPTLKNVNAVDEFTLEHGLLHLLLWEFKNCCQSSCSFLVGGQTVCSAYGKKSEYNGLPFNWSDTASKWPYMKIVLYCIVGGGSWASVWLPLPQKIDPQFLSK